MNDDHAIIIGTAKTLATMVDGTVRLKIDIEPKDRNSAMQMFGEPGTVMALALLDENNIRQYDLKQKSDYGEQAKALKLSNFFRTPKVWSAIGTDKEFRSWLRLQKCSNCGKEETQAAHVRRLANGSGMGVRPEYSSIPLCYECHLLEQHAHGESALEIDMDKERIKYLQKWCWETLKQQFGYESWSQVPPNFLYVWARDTEVDKYLPEEYKNV